MRHTFSDAWHVFCLIEDRPGSDGGVPGRKAAKITRFRATRRRVGRNLLGLGVSLALRQKGSSIHMHSSEPHLTVPAKRGSALLSFDLCCFRKMTRSGSSARMTP